MTKTLAVLGAGAWGTTLAKLLAEKGHRVKLWCFEDDVAAAINEQHCNRPYLAGVSLPAELTASSRLSEVLEGTEAVVSAVIARGLRDVMREARAYWPKGAYCLTASKGLEPESHLRMSEVIASELGIASQRMAAVSGPNHAEEISRQAFAGAVVASEEREVAEYFQQLLMCEYYRVYTSPDLIGVELGGALKNVIAIAAGICDGIGMGDNAKAALVTRGLAEMTRLGGRLGADALTFSGLSGIGDLMVTCNSQMSRNRNCGEQIGRGKSYQQIFSESRAVIEGARTAIAVRELAERQQVEMPISETVYDILYNDHPVEASIGRLMHRIAKPEGEGMALQRWNRAE